MTNRPETPSVALERAGHELRALLLVGAVLVLLATIPTLLSPPAISVPPKAWRHRIDLNAASKEELTLLPGVGPAYAGRLVRNRREAGPFRTLDDLCRVPGLPLYLSDRIRNHASAQHPGGS